MLAALPGVGEVGVAGLAAAGVPVVGAVFAAGSLSLSPVLMRSVFRPLRLLISVTVVRIAQGGVRIGIEAPSDTPVIREELKADLAAGESRTEISQSDVRAAAKSG